MTLVDLLGWVATISVFGLTAWLIVALVFGDNVRK